jgi:hypothetical protein
MCLPSAAMTVLLDFWPMAKYLERTRMAKFRPEIFPTGRYHCSLIALKVPTKTDIVLM